MTRFHETAVAAEANWMMQLGERFAFEGLLAQLTPRIAVEIGTWEGGSLRRIAAHAEHVHAFDIDERSVPHAEALDNATLHLGDATVEVPRVLAELHARGEAVDFALVDGLHTYDAVQADARSLLDADACHTTTIVFHDTAHAGVRAGLEALDLASHPKVSLWLPDFVPGYLVRDDDELPEEIRGRGFNGLGLLVLDQAYRPPTSGHEMFVPFADLRPGDAGA
jgi:Methyltransferase domain